MTNSEVTKEQLSSNQFLRLFFSLVVTSCLIFLVAKKMKTGALCSELKCCSSVHFFMKKIYLAALCGIVRILLLGYEKTCKFSLLAPIAQKKKSLCDVTKCTNASLISPTRC